MLSPGNEFLDAETRRAYDVGQEGENERRTI
jgi:hypothetical protein